VERISVVGTSGSGKTTLARALARRLDLPYVELDGLFWGPDWSQSTDDEFRARVRAAAAADRWVIDGNYSIARDIVQPRADTLVWLDLPFLVVLARTARRTVTRALTGEQLWHGNTERWRRTLSRDSLIWWVITTHRGRRKRWEEWLRRPESGHLDVVRLRSRRAVREWLTAVPRRERGEGAAPGSTPPTLGTARGGG
jgi:adenylate kinase family enzyme